MVTSKKRGQNTAKIDESLLKRIKVLFDDEEVKIRYPTIKNFINIAVLELLKDEEKKK